MITSLRLCLPFTRGMDKNVNACKVSYKPCMCVSVCLSEVRIVLVQRWNFGNSCIGAFFCCIVHFSRHVNTLSKFEGKIRTITSLYVIHSFWFSVSLSVCLPVFLSLSVNDNGKSVVNFLTIFLNILYSLLWQLQIFKHIILKSVNDTIQDLHI